MYALLGTGRRGRMARGGRLTSPTDADSARRTPGRILTSRRAILAGGAVALGMFAACSPGGPPPTAVPGQSPAPPTPTPGGILGFIPRTASPTPTPTPEPI